MKNDFHHHYHHHDPYVPCYPDENDYTTNAPSYYDDLARKNKLIKMLAEKIWEYENTLNETLEQIETRLTDYILENDTLMNERLENWDQRIDEMPEEMRSLFVTWLNDGTLEQIINHDVLGNKADKTFVDSEIERMEGYINKKQNQYYIDAVKDYNAYTNGTTNNKDIFMELFSNVGDNTEIFFPKGDYFLNNTDTFLHPLNPEDAGLGGDTSFASLVGKKNIKISGEKGTRFIINQDITIYSLWVFSFYGCENIEISGIEINYNAYGNPNVMTHPLTNVSTGKYAQTRAGLIKFQSDNDNKPCKHIHIHHNKFRLHHIEGAYPGSAYNVGSVPYSGSGKLIGLLLYGVYGTTEETSTWIEDITVEHNTFNETQARVIWLWVAKKAKILNNQFLNGCGGHRPCVRVLHGMHDLEVSSNYFEIANNWKTGTNHEPAINVADNGGTHYRRNITIKDNHIITQHGAGIDISGVDVAFVKNNHIEVDKNYDEDIMEGQATYTGIRLRGTGSDPVYKMTKNVIVDGNIVKGKQYGIHAQVYEGVKIVNNIIGDCRVGIYYLNYATVTALEISHNLIRKNVNGFEHNITSPHGTSTLITNNDIVLNDYGFYGFVSGDVKISMYLLFNRFNGNTVASFHRHSNAYIKSVGNIWLDEKQVENDSVVNEVELYE